MTEALQVFGAMTEPYEWLMGLRKPPRECLVEGAAGGGKTRTILRWLYQYALQFPGARIVLLRATRCSMDETVLPELEENVLGLDHPSVRTGQARSHRDHYDVGNGSRFILRGFDNEYKLYSGQAHIIYYIELGEHEDEEKWGNLYRARRAVMHHPGQFRMLIGCMNPREKEFWANRRANEGTMHRLKVKLCDNPRWYDHTGGEWTPDGIEYIQGMAAGLVGTSRDRLLFGEWVSATGALLPEWDESVHMVRGTQSVGLDGERKLTVEGWPSPVDIRWCFGAMDVGYEDAGVFQIWGVDGLNRMFCLEECYRTHWTHQNWVAHITPRAREYRLQGMACDHDKALIAAINQSLLSDNASPFARTADKTMGMSGTKAKSARIERFRARLVRRELFILRDCNVNIDERLQGRKRPWCTPMEIPALSYAEYKYGEDPTSRQGEMDKRKPDHGFDTSLYAVVYCDGRDIVAAPQKPLYAPGTYGHLFKHEQRLRRMKYGA